MRRKRALQALASLVTVPLGTLAFFQLTAFDPPPQLSLQPVHAAETPAGAAPHALSLLTWNIGYAGLDRDADFFMDGGTMTGPRSMDAVRANLAAIVGTLERREADVMFLQEVDRASARTGKIDQVAAVGAHLPRHHAWFATNFRSPFVPYPLTAPIGAVESGLLTLSRFASSDVSRHQLPGSYGWPKRLFHLKRCATVLVMPSPFPRRNWVLINVHLSAFDDGTLRIQQLDYLKQVMLTRYEAGDFVVLGGDWNSLPPGVLRDRFKPYTTTDANLFWLQEIRPNWTPKGWTWAFDPATPTCRSNEQPYREHENYRTIVDAFLLSPNVVLESVQTADLHFANTDHQPVMAQVRCAVP